MINLTIFGGTGDLTFRKLIPALYQMRRTGALPEESRIVVIGRRDYSDGQYRAEAEGWVKQFSRLPCDAASYAAFAARITYFRMDFTAKDAYPALGEFYARHPAAESVFYLAVAPRFFGVIAEGLGTLAVPNAKVVLEKPFGETLPLAAALNRSLEAVFGPGGIYRIDHYLGKEMVRNLQAIRFRNRVFSSVWNSENIEAVEISALEDVGVETRGGYYDKSGALRDMVQNHLFQVLTILAMERPAAFTAEEIHRAQLGVLKALRAPAPGSLVLGQYEGYRQEDKVAPDSRTETFAAVKLEIDNPRWAGTPFYIRTGKKTGVRETEAAVLFRSDGEQRDVLRVRIQPEEGVVFRFNIKKPGETEEITAAEMDFCQSCNVENHRNTPEAYERLLGACLRGEQDWFSQWDQIEASWAYVDKLRALPAEVFYYAPGERGPAEADALPARDGLAWLE